MSLRFTDRGLIYLDAEAMTAIFDCVYGIDGDLTVQTRRLLNEQGFEDFVKLLLSFQNYNYRYRVEQTIELFSLFEATVGPMERNSDGTTLWLALGLAIKDVYGLRRETLKVLLDKIKIRK